MPEWFIGLVLSPPTAGSRQRREKQLNIVMERSHSGRVRRSCPPSHKATGDQPQAEKQTMERCPSG